MASCMVLFVWIFLLKSAASLSLTCEFTFESWPIEPLYTCKTSSLTYDGSSKLNFVTGSHLNESYSNDDVQGLWLLRGVERLLFMPDDFNNYFQHIRAIKFDNTMIETISSSDLQQFPELRIFMSSYNPITTLPGDLFQFNPLLRQFYMFGLADPEMNIRYIGENLFTNLAELETVRFYGHSCIENEYASTKSEVEELIKKLHIMCPGEATTAATESTTEFSSTSVVAETSSETSTVEFESTTSSTRILDSSTTSGQSRIFISTLTKLLFVCIFMKF